MRSVWTCGLLVLFAVSALGNDSDDCKKYRVVCYMGSWSTNRENELKFSIEGIDGRPCTHLLYAYAAVKSQTGIIPLNETLDIGQEAYRRFTNLKKKYPHLKIYLSAAGSKAGSQEFSRMVSDRENRENFIKTSSSLLRTYGFDGLDIVWKYPGFKHGSSSSDKPNLVKLFKEMYEYFNLEGRQRGMPPLEISIAVPIIEAYLDGGFDVVALSRFVQFMTIISYDYHLPNDPTVHHLAPLYGLPQDHIALNIDASVKLYLDRGIKPELLNIAIPLFGIILVLEDPNKTEVGSLATDEGQGAENGFILFNQICRRLKDEENWVVKYENKTAIGPYAYKGTTWMSYDDEEMIRTKARYVKKKGLGGMMFWTVDEDDFSGYCYGKPYPLISAGADELRKCKEKRRSTQTIITDTPPTTVPTATAGPLQKSEPIIKMEIFNKTNSKTPFAQHIQIWITNNYYGIQPPGKKVK